MAALLPVEDAIARIVDGVEPLSTEDVSLEAAAGRSLALPLTALRSQPPFDASAMDGYALRAVDAAVSGARLSVIGMSAAGRRFAGAVGPGEAVRIFTGAPVPVGADAILIQENAVAEDGNVTVTEPVVQLRHIRRAGYDFREGETALAAGDILGMRELALAAAFGHGRLPVRRRPLVAVIATGDELVPPGVRPGQDQIVATNALAITTFVRARGGDAVDLGIARDTVEDIGQAVDRANGLGADVLVTIGGASVGDHDLVRPALETRGLSLDFWRIAMRPGKPLMFGRMPSQTGKTARVLGLPGNPASSMVCALVFLTPLLDALLGRAPRDATEPAIAGADLPANDHRQDYLRSRLAVRDDGIAVATPLPAQDSGMLSALTRADGLLIRPPHAPAIAAGSPVRILRLP